MRLATAAAPAEGATGRPAGVFSSSTGFSQVTPLTRGLSSEGGTTDSYRFRIVNRRAR